MATMAAVGSFAGLPIDDPQALQDVAIDIPDLRPRDVLVEIAAVSVNPVDIKRRQTLAPSSSPVILGFDAAGVVTAVGPEVSTLWVGDEVWYAGDISRPGTNAQFHAVDERIVSRKPRSLSFADAAAAGDRHGEPCGVAAVGHRTGRGRGDQPPPPAQWGARVAWHWEFMFTKPLFGLSGQQELLARTAQLVDDGIIRSTVTQTIDDFSARGLREAHKAVESGLMVGKDVVRR